VTKEKIIPFTNHSTIYGPVKSWRFGMSLGIDPLFYTSTCSFNCIYCQLGHIQNITNEMKVYVETNKVVSDFKEHIQDYGDFDVITFSGSGEPTLASNLGEMARKLKKISSAPLLILTNATHLDNEQVIQNLQEMDRIIVKLDAWSEDMLQKINRPAPGVTLKKIQDSILKLKDRLNAEIDLQIMVMPINIKEIHQMGEFMKQLGPSHVQLNTPKRPYPLSWHRENRGNHLKIFDYEVRDLKVIQPDKAKELEDHLKSYLPAESIISIYRD
jgi:wyosine [tRNA(Phe)-imidazoG37] synthetase (radical SAM superfamily)